MCGSAASPVLPPLPPLQDAPWGGPGFNSALHRVTSAGEVVWLLWGSPRERFPPSLHPCGSEQWVPSSPCPSSAPGPRRSLTPAVSTPSGSASPLSHSPAPDPAKALARILEQILPWLWKRDGDVPMLPLGSAVLRWVGDLSPACSHLPVHSPPSWPHDAEAAGVRLQLLGAQGSNPNQGLEQGESSQQGVFF